MLLKLADEVQTGIQTGIQTPEQRIAELMEPMNAEAERLLAVPGLKGVVVPAVLAEIGTDMSKFPSSAQLRSCGQDVELKPIEATV